jgi:hypothetical protein
MPPRARCGRQHGRVPQNAPLSWLWEAAWVSATDTHCRHTRVQIGSSSERERAFVGVRSISGLTPGGEGADGESLTPSFPAWTGVKQRLGCVVETLLLSHRLSRCQNHVITSMTNVQKSTLWGGSLCPTPLLQSLAPNTKDHALCQSLCPTSVSQHARMRGKTGNHTTQQRTIPTLEYRHAASTVDQDS